MFAESGNRCCVLVPLYRPCLSKTEALSLLATYQRAVGAAELAILHPPELSGFVQVLDQWFCHRDRQGQAFRSFEFPTRYFQGVSAYSSLLLSESFYARFSNYEWLFIIQPDALLLSDQWPIWLDSSYSYIGAPWFVGLEQPRRPLRPLGGGNGGFSLRRIAHCREVLRYRGWLYRYWRSLEITTLPDQRFRAEWRACRRLFSNAGSFEKLDLYEDLFWSFIAPQISSAFCVAPFSIAARFAFETEPRALFRHTQVAPLGCHAYERHDPLFWDQMWRSHPTLIGSFIESVERLMVDLQQGGSSDNV
jgi:hypothetical protein